MLPAIDIKGIDLEGLEIFAVHGIEGFMSADYWGYDSRLGRRWEQDIRYYYVWVG